MRTLRPACIVTVGAVGLYAASILRAGAGLPPPAKIANILRSGPREERAALAQAFALVSPGLDYCSDFKGVKLNYVILELPGPQAVLRLDGSNSCWASYVVTLGKGRSGAWTHLSTFTVGDKYYSPNISFESLIKDEEKEIIIRKNEIMYGTGWLQRNLTILKMHRGELEAVFDEPQEMILAIPSSSEKGFYNTEQHDKSVFIFAPGANGNPKPEVIYEHQIIQKHQSKITRWRVFYWNTEARRFQYQLIDTPDAPTGDLHPF